MIWVEKDCLMMSIIALIDTERSKNEGKCTNLQFLNKTKMKGSRENKREKRKKKG